LGDTVGKRGNSKKRGEKTKKETRKTTDVIAG